MYLYFFQKNSEEILDATRPKYIFHVVNTFKEKFNGF